MSRGVDREYMSGEGVDRGIELTGQGRGRYGKGEGRSSGEARCERSSIRLIG